MITLKYFAAIKEFFTEKEQLEIEDKTISDLRQILINKNPSCTSVLNSCRFAVDLSFVTDDYLINGNETISIIPPAGGG